MDPELIPQDVQNSQELALIKKKIRLERKKQKKLQRKERLLERKKILLKDYLAREIKYGQHTLRKYQAEWEKLLKTIALPRQLEEVELAQQNFERIMDIKDYVISCLMDKLHWDEDYYIMCLNTHISKIDDIIARFHNQLEEFRNDYNKQIEFLADKENEFITTMENITLSRLNDLKIILYGLAFQDKTEEIDMRAEFSATMEAEMDRQEVMLFQPRIEFEGMLRFLWEAKNEVFQTYDMKVKIWRSDYKEKRLANENFEKMSTRQLKKIERLSASIKQMRSYRIDFYKLELDDLKFISNHFREAYLRLKQQLTADLKIDKRKHEILVWKSENTYSELKKIVYLGRNLINLLQYCKKLETAEEKIRPYPLFLNRNENENKERLFLFWQKMGKADASRSALEEEKMVLKLENNYLRKSMENLCVCAKCPKLPPIYRKDGPFTFRHGATTMKKIDLKFCARRR